MTYTILYEVLGHAGTAVTQKLSSSRRCRMFCTFKKERAKSERLSSLTKNSKRKKRESENNRDTKHSKKPPPPPSSCSAFMILVAMSVRLLGRAHVQHLLPRHGFIHVFLDDTVVSRRGAFSIDKALATGTRIRSESAVFLLREFRFG